MAKLYTTENGFCERVCLLVGFVRTIHHKHITVLHGESFSVGVHKKQSREAPIVVCVVLDSPFVSILQILEESLNGSLPPKILLPPDLLDVADVFG